VFFAFRGQQLEMGGWRGAWQVRDSRRYVWFFAPRFIDVVRCAVHL